MAKVPKAADAPEGPKATDAVKVSKARNPGDAVTGSKAGDAAADAAKAGGASRAREAAKVVDAAKVSETADAAQAPMGVTAADAARAARLRTDVETRAEDRPGVYQMRDARGDVLYVGKSVRVRSRLLSYFRACRGEKSADLIRSTTAILWEYAPNEFWALVRELRLIKRWSPRFNVEHTRKPSYAFVKLTREPAPRLLPVGRVVEDGSTYFGPFPRPTRLAETIRELSHALGLRDCPPSTPIVFGDQLDIFSSGRAPRCLRADTGSCLAPCAGRCTWKAYDERARAAREFLEGRSREPIRRTEEAMRTAAGRRDFEYAAILRDRTRRLTRLQETLVGFRGRVESLTFVYRLPGFRGNDRLYLLRRGLVVADLPHPKSRQERLQVNERISEVFSAPDWTPDRIGGDEAAEMLLVARWFGRRPREARRIRGPAEWLSERSPA